DRLLPAPGPGLYLGLLVATGLYAFAGAFGLLFRGEALLLWALYTLAWMLSMHDSYQHHYLLSWLLGFAIFAPRLSIRECLAPELRAREVSFPLFATCCALVYVFTAISKSSPAWQSGAVLRRLSDDGGALTLAPRLLLSIGLEETDAWHFAALIILISQLVIAIGFFSACFRDAHSSRLLSALCSLALLGALVFHVSTELTPSFAIGWFSYYMIWFAVVCLMPAHWLSTFLNMIARFCTVATPEIRDHRARFAAVALSLLLAAGWLSVEALPGMGPAVLLFACAWSIRGWWRPLIPAQRAFASALLPALAMGALAAALSLGQVRFDYYRRLAGELSRMGQREAALRSYRLAERHAPAGQSRKTKIRELERSLEAQRALQRENDASQPAQ
ncbi:MAG TPA: HTTM domain-containing protein, partial [Polyangiales bacterium]|nr:HTTM domain-containing protein [Polyangiales bacterium]